MTIVSYISVPLIAMLGITAMIMAVRQGDAYLAEKFAESQGLGVITGAGMVIGSFVSGGTATPNFARFAKTPKAAVWTLSLIHICPCCSFRRPIQRRRMRFFPMWIRRFLRNWDYSRCRLNVKARIYF